MFSLQRAVGQDDEVLSLLEASAKEACASVAALKTLVTDPGHAPNLERFRAVRKKQKQILETLANTLLYTLVLAMEREDIDELGESIYRVPKTVDNFAHRYLVAAAHVGGVDFSRQMDLMERGCGTVAEMIRGLKERVGISQLKQLNANMQKIESDAMESVGA